MRDYEINSLVVGAAAAVAVGYWTYGRIAKTGARTNTLVLGLLSLLLSAFIFAVGRHNELTRPAGFLEDISLSVGIVSIVRPLIGMLRSKWSISTER